MSSCPPIRCGSGQATVAALLSLLALLALAGAPAAAAQPALVAVPGGTAEGQTRLLVQVPDGAAPIRPDAFTVSVDGGPQPTRAQPVLSDRLALGLVVDSSTEGGPVLQAGLSGAASLVLAAPPSARSTLVTDSTPPTVAVPWPSGPTDTLRGLSAVRSDGDRDTAAALDLVVAQLRAPQPDSGATDPRLVVLFTGAPDAGGEPAEAIVERLRSAGVLLAVVGTAGGSSGRSDFWTTVAAGTGGVAVAARPRAVIGAFDQVAAALDARYLVTFPTPARLPATVAVRVETSSGPLTSEVVVPPATSGPASSGPGRLVAVGFGLAVAVALAAGVIALVRRRARRDGGPPGAPGPGRSAATQIWNIPDRPEAAVDRAALLAEMAARLHVGGPVWLRPHTDVTGLGTTTAMIDFAHRHRARYDVAWWIPALDPDLVPDRLAELAEALGLASTADPADQATAALLAALPRRHRWLLVFDDAGSPHELARYLPDGPGDVLIASPDPEWRELASPVTVPAFTRGESVALLRSRRPALAPEPADRIAATLGDLPLAVGPAAALLADTGMDVDPFLALLAERPAAAPRADAPDAGGSDAGGSDAGGSDAGGSDAGGSDAGGSDAVWTVLVDRLAADDPQALALLTLLAWLGPAPMPLSLIIDHAGPLPEPLRAAARQPAELATHTAMLRRRGLAQVTADDLLLHPAPAALLIDRTGQDHPGDGGWAAIAVRLLRAAAPDRPAAERADWPTWRRLLPHVLAATDPARPLDVVADDVGWLLAQAGGYLAARGLTGAARALLEDAHGFDVGARLRAFGESP